MVNALIKWCLDNVFLMLIAMAAVPLGALMILSSGVRMISAGHVGVALLFVEIQQGQPREGGGGGRPGGGPGGPGWCLPASRSSPRLRSRTT